MGCSSRVKYGLFYACFCEKEDERTVKTERLFIPQTICDEHFNHFSLIIFEMRDLICKRICVLDCPLTGQDIIGADTENLADARQVLNTNRFDAAFKIGDHLNGYIHFFGKLFLRVAELLSSFADSPSDFL